eukprot:TRINITY_DN15519_c0_g1_i3.p1 TRINITY_DN15519_c0_g1~~TRINITY_DN15519_c0_g1_i3.p1  ORF type:complete len:278 (+),score=62.08 TRINITY_DN15519_c0_g1_i3:147-980(+)
MCNIYPLTYILNKFIKNKIGPRKQFTMWFSGLRGAIAFVLALQASEDFKSQHGDTILTTTIMVIFFTVFVFGGYIWPVLEKLELLQPRSGEGEFHLDPFLPAIYLLEEISERQEGDLEDDEFEMKATEAIEALHLHVGALTEDIRLMEDVKAGTADEEEMGLLMSRLRGYAHMSDTEVREEHWRHETGAWIECLCNGLLWCRDRLSTATLERDKLRESMRAGSPSSAIQMAVLRTSSTGSDITRSELHCDLGGDEEETSLTMEDDPAPRGKADTGFE